MNILSIIFFLIGVFCLAYLVEIIMYAGTGTAFLWFWLYAGIACIIFSIILYLMYRHKIVVGKQIKICFISIVLLGLTFFFFVEGIIIRKGSQLPEPGADYVIVLGAQVRGKTLSRALKNRLDTACEYLEKNKSIVIVSGGQGTGEDISEAEAMSEYLISKGIEESRIIKEDQSTNTNENIMFSKKVMEEGKSVVVVTNRFHVYRATLIAQKQGLSNVQGLGAPTDDILTLSYYVREFFALIKDKMVGNI